MAQWHFRDGWHQDLDEVQGVKWWFGRHKQPQSAALSRTDRSVEVPGMGLVRIQVQIDCLGAVCPRPQLLTMRALDHMQEGEILELQVDNPGSSEAIPAMCMTLGSTHLGTVRDDAGWRIYVRKGDAEIE
jgi:tRNA 2-thiouridine synthesizing protein A